MKYKIFLLCYLSISMVACQDDAERIADEQSEIDKKLLEVLGTASDGLGVSFFTLPSSTDFASIPQDSRNPLTDEKVALGQLLYHETGLAMNPIMEQGMKTYSCASCHHVQAGFQAGIRQGLGDGGVGFGAAGEGRKQDGLTATEFLDVQPVRSPSTLNSAYQVAQLWNGQFGAVGPNAGTQSQWKEGTPLEANFLGYEGVETQAIAGLSVHRLDCDTALILHSEYKDRFDRAFSSVSGKERYGKETAGLAIAAYERTLLPDQAPWQLYLKGDSEAMNESQKLGATLFFGKANCVSCHTGPALNSMEFYALGMGDLIGEGVFRFRLDDPAHRGRGSFTANPEDDYKFKVPQLYNLKDSPFYGHGGTFRTVREVIDYKNEGIAENTNVPYTKLDHYFVPLQLSEEEVQQLTDFVENALYDSNLERYIPNKLPSNQSFPNNDAQSQQDLNF